MKNIFRKKMKNIEEFSKEPQVMTNGNKYEVYKDLETQKNLDLNTLRQMENERSGVQDIQQLTGAIRRIGEEIIREKEIEPYFLLQLQADYFCNTCRFEAKETYIRRMIIQVIRGAFLMGCAGVYKNTELDILEPVYITGLEYGIDAKLKSAKILPLGMCLQRMNETKTFNSNELKGFRTLNEKQCESLAVFYWGTMGYSAWIKIFPFVKLQHMMLTIIIINGFVFNKKWIYKLNNFSNIKDEIELFFNPANPFIVNLGNTDELANRFSTDDVSSTNGAQDVIDYYNKLIGVYYQLLGRKINSDYKKERNISDEVEASQENYDVVQSDWLNQFEIFIDECKALGISIEYVEQEKEQEGGEDDETDRKDNAEPDSGE